MAEFQELIKNFDKIRDYMRQFYIYGFKVRSEYQTKSLRTYDNERRRIESFLSDYIQSVYSPKGKQIFLSIDSKSVPQNPLYSAWKSKSFTNNDILLHFFILDLLSNPATEKLRASDFADLISALYGMVFDNQTIRLKLKEYETLGLLRSESEQKSVYYSLIPDFTASFSKPTTPSTAPSAKTATSVTPISLSEDSPALSQSTWEHLLDAVKFFQGTAPLGVIGSTILDHWQEENDLFRFQNHFIVHTLEDEILLKLLTAIHEKRNVTLQTISSKKRQLQTFTGTPLQIFISTQTGRHYVCIYNHKIRRFHSCRLDFIQSVEPQECLEEPNYANLRSLLKKNLPFCWGVSFGSQNSRMEHIYMKLWIDEKKEPYILQRLHREGRNGEILKVTENTFLYSGSYFETNEILPWVKTFTGRILDIQGTNPFVIGKLCHDLDKMYEMYKI